jgi:hypothetical protein
MPADKRPLKVFLCHIMSAGYAHSDRDAVKALPAGTRLTTLAPGASAGEDGVDRFAVAQKSQTPPRVGLGIGASQGRVKVGNL